MARTLVQGTLMQVQGSQTASTERLTWPEPASVY